MATLPALEDSYHTRANLSVPDVSTAAAIWQYVNWAYKSFLLNTLSTGTTAGSRNANATWTCLGSSDGATAGMDGVDRWTSTFTPSKLVLAASGTAHSWIALRNATAGYDIVIDLNSATAGTAGYISTKSSTGFTGGSTTTRPTAASEDWMAGSAANATSTASTVWGDLTTGTPHYISFVTGSSGARMAMMGHRSTGGLIHSYLGFWSATEGSVSDTRNQWWIKHNSTSGRGALVASAPATTNNWTRRTYGNALPNGQTGCRLPSYAGNVVSGVGTDVITGNYFTLPMEAASAASGAAYHCGRLMDLYWISGGTVGGCYPSAGAMERVIIGDVLHPFGVPPTI